MARLYLVRHGEAAAAYGEADDPGLSELGRRQAGAAAERLFALGLRQAICSPMRRCRETAAPFEALAGAPARIEPAVGEIPTPPQRADDRQAWLRALMAGDWSAHPSFTPWRERMAALLAATAADLVVFSHYVAINALVGAATGSDRVVNFAPVNGSITVLEAGGGRLRLVSLGGEARGGQVL